MSRANGYDTQNAVFSPDGRLLQVEYALGSAKIGKVSVGICTQDGILLAGVVRRPSEIQVAPRPKLYKISNNIVCGGSGMIVDIDLVINHARQEALRHRLVRNREIPCSRLIRRLSELYQGYTSHRALRPLSAEMIFAGYDEQGGFQLFIIDASGAFNRRKACCTGAIYNENELLMGGYSDDLTLEEARKLAVDVIAMSCAKSDLPETLEMVQLSIDERGILGVKTLSEGELQKYVKSSGGIDNKST